ncbi:SCP2 sterol-binding domain-containing protein [Pseudonocardia benzenivorans]
MAGPGRSRARVADRDQAGEAVYGGEPIPDRKPDFVLTAASAVWRRVAAGEISAANAIMTRKIKFVGPVKVAMSHMPVLSTGLRLVGEVDGLVWGTETVASRWRP